MKRYKQARRFWPRIAPLVAFVFVVSSLPQHADRPAPEFAPSHKDEEEGDGARYND